MSEFVQEIREMDELIHHCNNNTFVVVDFYTPKCPPCTTLAPFIEKLARENPHITFKKVNCLEENNIALPNEISAVPVLLYIRNHKVVHKTLGGDINEILNAIANL